MVYSILFHNIVWVLEEYFYTLIKYLIKSYFKSIHEFHFLTIFFKSLILIELL